MNKLKHDFYVVLVVFLCLSVAYKIIEDINFAAFYHEEFHHQRREKLEREIRFLNKRTENLNKQLLEKDLIIKDLEESVDVLTFQINDLVEKHKVSIEKKRRLLIEGKRSFAF